MPSQISRYQEMSELSARMVEAAHAGDWEKLSELESALAGLRDDLAASDDATPLDETALAQKALLIQHILANHDEVLRYAQPRLKDICHDLDDITSRRRIDQAYGVEES